jgi:tRNA (guanosine-2'-O-)-methyltransferase
MFGTELKGLSQKAMAMSDLQVRIPMVGFTESFNISVSVALSLYALTRRLKQSEVNWALQADEINTLLLNWARLSVKSSDNLEKLFLAEKNSQAGNGG